MASVQRSYKIKKSSSAYNLFNSFNECSLSKENIF